MKFWLCMFLALFSLATVSQTLLAQSLSKQAAIERALERNLALKRQRSLWESAEARALMTLSPEKPVVSYYTEEMLNSPTETQIVRRWQISQGFEFPLTTYYRARSQAKLAASLESETAELRNEIVASVRIAYASALVAESMLRLAEENRAVSQRFYEMSKRLSDVGEASELQVLRAKAELSRAENALADAHATFAEAKQRLALLMGNPADTAFRLSDSLRGAFPVFDFAMLYRAALESRPLLKAMQARLESAELARSAAYLALLPSFRLTIFQQRFAPAENPFQNFYGGEISLSVPLWFWLEGRGEIEEKSALLRAQEHETRLAIQQLETELRNAFVRYESAKTQAQRAETEERAAAERAFRAAERLLQTGNIGYIEFLEAKRAYFDSEKNALEKRFLAERALAELLRAAGILNFNE
ncbi:MAG: TolC family protein [Chloroherpetonaceae bacterium]|nr:TolC family protein [Chloroherpetonaceae bacterium]MCS7211865.1 TolC family protein [Chloroherpetonaceae bacterium]MDW8019019.1 TolC family protein [Chloroherpetonaceae bacterium]